MIIQVSLAALQAGQQVQLTLGDTLQVTVEIKAIMPKQVNTELWMSLIVGLGRDYTVKKSLALAQSDTERTYTETIDMPITSGLGLKNMIYDLWAELPAFNRVEKVSAAVILTGVEGGGGLDISGIMGMMIVVMMMSMIMPMMTGEEGEGGLF